MSVGGAFLFFLPGNGSGGSRTKGLEEGHKTRGHEDWSFIHSTRFPGTRYASDTALNTGDSSDHDSKASGRMGCRISFSFRRPAVLSQAASKKQEVDQQSKVN